MNTVSAMVAGMLLLSTYSYVLPNMQDSAVAAMEEAFA
jgi:hypothetical protein